VYYACHTVYEREGGFVARGESEPVPVIAGRQLDGVLGLIPSSSAGFAYCSSGAPTPQSPPTKFQLEQPALVEMYWSVQPFGQLKTPMQFPAIRSRLCVHEQRPPGSADAGTDRLTLTSTAATRSNRQRVFIFDLLSGGKPPESIAGGLTL
jgi:hypothetical protein